MHRQKANRRLWKGSEAMAAQFQKVADDKGLMIHRRLKIGIAPARTKSGRKSRRSGFGVEIKKRIDKRGHTRESSGAIEQQVRGGQFAMTWSAMCELAFDEQVREHFGEDVQDLRADSRAGDHLCCHSWHGGAARQATEARRGVHCSAAGVGHLSPHVGRDI